ncbi:MAG: hypothetical protein NTU97_03655 [Candidatus Magasanikbacteria bacterium]|nr:hypothetical protein [Candidatus Magasanikbacteria bacterium]
MCFSSTASFTASGFLTVVGIATLAKTKQKKTLLIMIVPLIFAFQQLIEGLLWLSLKNGSEYSLPLTYLFLFFALFFWPIYIPFVALLLEPQKIRRRIILFFCFGGILVGILLFVSFLQKPEVVRVVNNCLFYANQSPYPFLLNYLYILFTIGSGAISSRPIIKIISLFGLTSALISWLIYSINFISVWCFFAAIMSVIIYFYPQKKLLKTKKG